MSNGDASLKSPSNSLNSEDLHGEENNEVVFDLNVVLEGFKKCKEKDDQIYLDHYLRAYIELNKFFQILGNVFNFVASDVQKKVTILQCFQKGGGGDYYYSVQSMMEYEKEHAITEVNSQNGSRTLLRLHRALEFITGFLEELGKATDDTKLGSVASSIYNQTLAKHHGWIVSKTVSALLLLMPSKQAIVVKVTRNDTNRKSEMEKILPEVIVVMKSVFTLTQKLYEDYDMLNLP